MTTTELRIDGCRKNITKTQKTLENKTKLLEKKAQKCNALGVVPEQFLKSDSKTSEQYWAYCDWDTTHSDIEALNKKLEEYKDRLVYWTQKKQAEEDKANVPMIPSVEAFLADYRVKAEIYYKNDVSKFKKWLNSYRSYREQQLKELSEIYGEYDIRVARKKSPEIKAEMTNRKVDENYQNRYIKNHFSPLTPRYASLSNSSFISTLTKELDIDVAHKRIDLYYRCSSAVGIISDASNLEVGDNGCINGIIIGDSGKAKVETIYAGGYNIQCLHFRVLVTPIKSSVEAGPQKSSKNGKSEKVKKSSSYKDKSLQELLELAKELKITPKDYSDERIFRMRLIMSIKAERGE